MSDVKGKKWIKNYIQMVIDEVKDVPKETRGSVPFRIKMTMKHKTFSEKFPSLLMMVVEQAEEFDHERLEVMLNLMDSVQKGERDGDEVDREMGQEYFDKYVAPHVKDTKDKN
jgi:hypothetical protein